MPDLDPGQSYCFMVAAYIPSRPKASRHGTLSGQSCIRRKTGTIVALYKPICIDIFIVCEYVCAHVCVSRSYFLILFLNSVLSVHPELSSEAWIAIVLTVTIIIIIVMIILYCKCCRRTNQNLQIAQSSALL